MVAWLTTVMVVNLGVHRAGCEPDLGVRRWHWC